MSSRGAATAVEKCNPAWARGWLAFVRGNGNIENPGGYLWRMLVEQPEEPPKARPPPTLKGSKEDRRGYAIAGLTMPIEVEESVPP